MLVLTTKVVTGATGSLGSHVVAQLAALGDVQRVYCLVRAGSHVEAYDRLLGSLRIRRVYDSLDDACRNKLTALPSSLSEPNLGLSPTTYNALASETTDIIHCAWSVNFNLHLRSFENDSISGLKNLIDLALKAHRPTPASLNFCSSVSAAVNTDAAHVPEALPDQLSHAQDMGYAQSKLVGEHICAQAAEQTGLASRVLRIGQVIGDTKHGIWNANEAIPLMLQSATTIGALPRLDEWPRWMPVDVVAGVVVDISLADDTTTSTSTSTSGNPGLDTARDPFPVVFNILNPHPFHWTLDLLPCLRRAGLQFEDLEQSDWVQRLRLSDPDPAVNPPVKLVEFFARKYGSGIAPGRLRWDTEKTKRVSGFFREVGPIDQGVVDGFVRYFREVGWVDRAGAD